jgi:hypothetical protein
MVPNKLVQIEAYDYAELASEDQRVLIDAGISAYIKNRGRGYPGASLMVAEENVEAAVAILSRRPSPFRQPKAAVAPICSYCGSSEIDAHPQYAIIPLGLGFAVAVVLAMRGDMPFGLAVFAAAAVMATIVFIRFSRGRCRRCGRSRFRPADQTNYDL